MYSFCLKKRSERKEKSQRIIRQQNLSEGDIVWKHAKEIWPEGRIFNDKMTIKDIKIRTKKLTHN